MFYSNEIVDKVRESVDIVDLISQYVSLKHSGSNHMGLCPFHSEKSPSFSVNRSKQMYHCFGCGESGNVFTFLMKYENYSFPEAVRYLGEKSGIELPKESESAESKRKSARRVRLLEVQKEAAYYFVSNLKGDSGKNGMDYFKRQRQLSDETINKFGLGYSKMYSNDLFLYLKSKGYEDDLLKDSGLVKYGGQDGGRDYFWNRVMFPIMDINNKVIAFGGRVLGDAKPKYLNSPETLIFEKNNNLYGLNYARRSRKQYILLCEGYMDVIALFQAGFDNAVASLGTAFTSRHALLLKRYTNQVYITYDSDEAGVKAALRAIPMLKQAGLSVKVVSMAPYKDPDEFIKNLGASAYEERIEKAQLGFYFETDVLKDRYDMQDPEQKTEFYEKLAKRLLNFSGELERENYIKAVAKRYDVPESGLRQLVFKYGVNMPSKEEQFIREAEERKDKKEERDRAGEAQAVLLTCLSEDVTLFEKLEGCLGPDDFTKEPYKTTAGLLFSQYREEKKVVPARILDQFEDLEDQRAVGEILNTVSTVSKEEISKEDREKIINQNLKRVLLNRLEEEKKKLESNQDLMAFVQRKKELDRLYIKL